MIMESNWRSMNRLTRLDTRIENKFPKGALYRQVILRCLVFVFLVFGMEIASARFEAKAEGITGHWVVGAEVLEILRHKEGAKGLAAFLGANQLAFRRGTVFPDAAYQYFKHSNLSDDQADELSHELKNKIEYGGLLNAYIRALVQNLCSNQWFEATYSKRSFKLGPIIKGVPKKNTDCAYALAFFFGMVNHIIADAPWRSEWIGKTTRDHCPDLPDDNDRLHVAKFDVDICLASRVNGNPSPLPMIVRTGMAVATGNKANSFCKAGEVSNFSDGHCYSCPTGYLPFNVDLITPLTSPISGNFKCVSLPHVLLKKGNRHGKASAGLFCPKDQWPSLDDDNHCYSCPSGYTHNLVLSGDKMGVCFKPVGKVVKNPTKGDRISLVCANDGEFTAHPGRISIFRDVPCFKCPSEIPDHSPRLHPREVGACQLRKTVPCDLVSDLPKSRLFAQQVRVSADFAGEKKANYEVTTRLLKESYESLGHKNVHIDEIHNMINRVYYDARRDPTASLAFTVPGERKKKGLTEFSPNARKCDWMYAHVMDKKIKGSIPDSAAKAAEFMAELWSMMTDMTKGYPYIVRARDLDYGLRAGLYFKSDWRYCVGKCP